MTDFQLFYRQSVGVYLSLYVTSAHVVCISSLCCMVLVHYYSMCLCHIACHCSVSTFHLCHCVSPMIDVGGLSKCLIMTVLSLL